MNFDKLYKTTSINKIYVWHIAIIKKGSALFEITSHGENGGKMVMHEKEILRSYGSRTLMEQAVQDATRKYTNKMEKEGYITNINALQTQVVFRPMLAHTFTFESLSKRGKTIEFPCFVQPKLDGIRCLAYLDANKNVVMESRRGVAFQHMNTIRAQLDGILSRYPTLCLDGEIYTDKLPFEVISGLVRLKNSITDAQHLEMGKLDYCVYDCIVRNNLDMPFNRRTDLIRTMNLCSPVLHVLTQTISSPDQIRPTHDAYVTLGYEGLMLRNIESKYEIDKRSKDLQKFKDFREEEFRIVGFHEGTGNDKGCVIWECVTQDGHLFSAEPVGTREHRRALFKDGTKHIGDLLTVKFFEYTKDGVPRFPKGKDIRIGY